MYVDVETSIYTYYEYINTIFTNHIYIYVYCTVRLVLGISPSSRNVLLCTLECLEFSVISLLFLVTGETLTHRLSNVTQAISAIVSQIIAFRCSTLNVKRMCQDFYVLFLLYSIHRPSKPEGWRRLLF